MITYSYTTLELQQRLAIPKLNLTLVLLVSNVRKAIEEALNNRIKVITDALQLGICQYNYIYLYEWFTSCISKPLVYNKHFRCIVHSLADFLILIQINEQLTNLWRTDVECEQIVSDIGSFNIKPSYCRTSTAHY